jgi:hypothetical protein
MIFHCVRSALGLHSLECIFDFGSGFAGGCLTIRFHSQKIMHSS